MYKNKPSFIYGFHGMDKKPAINILNKNDNLRPSNNDFDWLGDGVYFWENNLERAWQYANEDMERSTSKIKEPFVLGAILDLGNCLDLLSQDGLDFIELAYITLKQLFDDEEKTLPKNSPYGKQDFDFKKRELDCAVIRMAHTLAEEAGQKFDSVRAAFWEGEELYPNAGFKKNNHIQIAIKNPDCIKGIFLPREKEEEDFVI